MVGLVFARSCVRLNGRLIVAYTHSGQVVQHSQQIYLLVVITLLESASTKETKIFTNIEIKYSHENYLQICLYFTHKNESILHRRVLCLLFVDSCVYKIRSEAVLLLASRQPTFRD